MTRATTLMCSSAALLSGMGMALNRLVLLTAIAVRRSCSKRRRSSKAGGKGFDDALLRARGQAEQYARALPATEGRPPFLLVVDVGNVIELYSEFTRSGATYTPYPDPRSHRIQLADLNDEATRQRLRAVWLDPLSLDPTRLSAKVTRDVAERLAEVARVLEAAGQLQNCPVDPGRQDNMRL